MPSDSKKHKRRRNDAKDDDQSSQGHTHSKRRRKRSDSEQEKRLSHSRSRKGTKRDRSESQEKEPRSSRKTNQKEKSGRNNEDKRDRRRDRKEPKKKRETRDRKSDRRQRERSSDRNNKEKRKYALIATIDTKNLCDIGTIKGSKPTGEISSSDYFSYHNHFRLYLYRSGSYFEDLSSSESKKAFKKFCSRFNDGQLEEGYYGKELSKEALEQCKRTKHSWNFKTNATEQKSLSHIKDGVRKQTEYKQKGTLKRSANVVPTAKMSVCLPVKEENTNTSHRRSVTREEITAEKEAILRKLGLNNVQPGQKITIAPRKS